MCLQALYTRKATLSAGTYTYKPGKRSLTPGNRPFWASFREFVHVFLTKPSDSSGKRPAVGHFPPESSGGRTYGPGMCSLRSGNRPILAYFSLFLHKIAYYDQYSSGKHPADVHFPAESSRRLYRSFCFVPKGLYFAMFIPES